MDDEQRRKVYFGPDYIPCEREEGLWLTWHKGTYCPMSRGDSIAQLGYQTMDELRDVFEALKQKFEFDNQEKDAMAMAMEAMEAMEAALRELQLPMVAEMKEEENTENTEIEDTRQTDSISLPIERQSSEFEAEIQPDKESKHTEDLEEVYKHLADISVFLEYWFGGKNRYKMNEKARPYTTSLSKLKENHPLMIMINEERWVILLDYLSII